MRIACDHLVFMVECSFKLSNLVGKVQICVSKWSIADEMDCGLTFEKCLVKNAHSYERFANRWSGLHW